MIKAKWTAERIQAGIIWHNDWFVDGTNLQVVVIKIRLWKRWWNGWDYSYDKKE